MKKLIAVLFIISAVFLCGFASAETAFTTALRTCTPYSQQGSAMNAGHNYTISISLEKNKKNCVYKEKISLGSGYQLLTCRFKNEDLSEIADNMSAFTQAYKDQIAKNKIFEAKLTNNYYIFEQYLVKPEFCKITSSAKIK